MTQNKTVSIKNVPDHVWRTFKSEAARQGQEHADFFERLIDIYMDKYDNIDLTESKMDE